MLLLGQSMMVRADPMPRQEIAINHHMIPCFPMKDGWRVVQFPQQFPAHPGMEYQTAYLRFEYILEKMEKIND